MYVIWEEGCCVDAKVLNEDMIENICYVFGDVAYLFDEFAKDFV